MARGEGAVVEDVDGNRFLDCAAGIAVTSTGHSHPTWSQAIAEQAEKFLHMSGTDFYYEPQVRAGRGDGGDRAGRRRPAAARSSATPGTEANEAAIKLARYETGRFNLIAFLGSFHGRTLGSLALTSSRACSGAGSVP